MARAPLAQPGPGEWIEGPWSGEPDRVAFELGGFRCVLDRDSSGAWCGYIGIPPGHPWHGLYYGDVKASAHQGLTYGRQDVPARLTSGAPADLHWFGFDCAHTGSGDLTPAWATWHQRHGFPLLPNLVYKTIDYARSQLERLAQQAVYAAVETPLS